MTDTAGISLVQLFLQNLPTPAKHCGASDVYVDWKSVLQLQKLGSHLEMSPDQIFKTRSKHM